MDTEKLAGIYQATTESAEFDNEKSIRATFSSVLKPGDSAVDVGVFSGRHLLAMANCVKPGGHVYGFEPIPGLARLVTAEATMRGVVDIVRISNCALADFSGTTTFNYVKADRGYSGLKARKSEGKVLKGETIEVGVTTLDKAIPADADIRFIKLDIEGGELWALRGGTELIERCCPVISLEVGRSAYSAYGVTAGDIADFFYGRGYLIADILGNRFEEPEEFLASERLSGIWDYVAIHREDGCLENVLTALTTRSPI